MTYAQRLQEQLNKAPSKEVYNAQKKVYDWKREASSLRPIR